MATSCNTPRYADCLVLRWIITRSHFNRLVECRDLSQELNYLELDNEEEEERQPLGKRRSYVYFSKQRNKLLPSKATVKEV